jgi:hypothetical protein
MGETSSGKPTTPPGSSLPAGASVVNRRRHDRLDFAAQVLVHELNNEHVPGKGHAAESVNLSRSGIGVRSKLMYYTGTEVVLIIQLKTDRRVKCGVVRSSRYAGGGMYQSGIEFTQTPPGARLHAWLESHPATP